MIDLKGLFKAGTEKVITATGKALDDLITSKEEREAAKLAIQQELNRHAEELGKQATEVEKAYLADVADSREMNARIQESDKASWLAKNIGYIIDIWLGFIWGVFTVYLGAVAIKLVETKADLTGMVSIYTTVTAVFMISVNWHRGSSQGSQNKQGMLDRMISKR